MAKKFNMMELAKEALGDVRVSEVDHVQQIPAGRIQPNPANFYEMSDIEELAASIELVGLIEPIKVKPAGEGYTIIDGERRYRALTEVLGRAELPCIVRVPVNDVVEELMLIEANRTQRKMSAADLSKQAERYTELLAQLKEAGVAIPGRLRDRVAEALQVSSTKLARLHAIREHLSPRMLERFDTGEINESMAYALSRYSHGQQAGLWDYGARTPEAVDIVARRAGFSVGYRDAAEAQPDEPKPEAPKTPEPTGTSWDAEAYMQQRLQEDEDFFWGLNQVADRFLPELADLNSRQEGIERLKERFGRCYESHWGYDNCEYEATPKGLILSSKERHFRDILRTWTAVYDMLCQIGLDRLGSGIRRLIPEPVEIISEESTAEPAGLEWHRIDPEHKPLFDFQKTVLLWGPGGLRSVPQHLIYDTIKYAPETVTHWAVVEGPEEEET